MNLLAIILLLIAIYIFIMYILSILVLPNLGWFSKQKETLPKNVLDDMKKLGKKKLTKKQLLKKVTEYELKDHYSFLGGTFKNFGFLFEPSIKKIWERKGFIHCNQHTLLINHLLLATGRFKQEDIKIQMSSCYIEIHQYLTVNTEDEWVIIDPFAISAGFNYGERLPWLARQELAKRKKQK